MEQNLNGGADSPKTVRHSRLFDLCWLLSCLLLSSIWCGLASKQVGVTFDEPTYLEEGLTRWRTGSTTGLMKLGTMPLPVDVQTLPLYLWEQNQGRSWDLKTDFHQALFWARLSNLLFWNALLIYVWLVARSLGGPWAGRLAVALVAFEPSFLAHASLATTDIAVTVCLLAFVYHFRANRAERWRWRVAWPALWFALAILAKASGLAFGGLCMLAADWQWRRSRKAQALSGNDGSESQPSFRSSWRDIWQVGLIAMVLVFLYCGSDFERQRSLVKWAHQLPEGAFGSSMVWVADHLKIFSNAGEGIIKQVTHNIRGHGVYILGQTHRRALWYYFPVVMSIKLTLPLLLAPLLLLFLRFRSARLMERSMNWALYCAMALIAFTVVCRVQLGIRLVLPIVSLLIVGLSAALVQAIEAMEWNWRAKMGTVLLGSGLGWTAVSSLLVWPNALCFVNAAWRPVGNDYELVGESNLDWGQGARELAQWQRQHAELPLTVWYYGTDPLIDRLPVDRVELHMQKDLSPEGLAQAMEGRVLVVSLSLAYGHLFTKEVVRAREWLHQQTPTDRTSTFLIYDFRQRNRQTVQSGRKPGS